MLTVVRATAVVVIGRAAQTPSFEAASCPNASSPEPI
jgi:hypothetical protein